MKKILTIAITGLITLLLCMGCSAKDMNITEDMNGQTISIVTGSKITLSLQSNPTTGFNWEIVDFDPSILSLVGEPYYKSDSALIGSGGVLTYTFQVLNQGTSNLKLVYQRSWEKEIAPAQTFEVIVEATSKK
jgi:inhibitor of cysteine peptidase